MVINFKIAIILLTNIILNESSEINLPKSATNQINQIQTCPMNCIKCQDSNTCKECAPKYYWDTNLNICNSCSSQISGCELCSDPQTCLKCGSGTVYFKMYKQCYPIHLSCEIFINSYCLKCHPGYYLDTSTAQCLKCSTSNCNKCSSDLKTCQECLPGYTLNQDSECVPCEDQYCDICKNSNKCDKCKISHYKTQNNTCSSCPYDGCLYCSQENCFSCGPGLYFNGERCLPCSSNCSVCNNSKSCVGCNINMGTDAGGNCKYCSDPNCLSCNDQICSTCSAGYYLNNQYKCVKCGIQNCDICKDENNCEICQQGFLTTNGTLGKKCSPCVKGCNYCLDENTCSYCSSGYFLNDNKTCSTCSENCLDCSKKNSCSQCQIGYYLTNNGDCNKCDKSCQECTGNSTYCTACINGKALPNNNGVCASNYYQLFSIVSLLALITFIL